MGSSPATISIKLDKYLKMSNQSTSQLPSASNTVPDAPREGQAALPQASAARVGQQIGQAQALRILPPDDWARGVAAYLRRLADRPIPGRLVHDYSPNRNAFVARDENREDVARYRANNNELIRRSLPRLPPNQYTFGTLNAIEDALQTLDPERQAALRALCNGMDNTFLVLHEDPHRPAFPHEELLEIMRRDSPGIVDALQALTPSCRVAVSTFIDRLEGAILRMNISPTRVVDADPLAVDADTSLDQQVSEVSENEDLHTPAIETPLPPYSRHDPLFSCSLCCVPIFSNDTYVRLRCHMFLQFHKHCIRRVLLHHRRCPLCSPTCIYKITTLEWDQLVDQFEYYLSLGDHHDSSLPEDNMPRFSEASIDYLHLS
ncbi:hypothetical protein PSTT_07738 [Puccinia striiformis]|uniref:RING-type domain-containing protein n=3 Tax=Puccinia striiformis TaxID=27350 RepID=A0A2S4VFH3_9BASI|nr:hypothetical protein PSTT_07738 [Puccinia striiformis]